MSITEFISSKEGLVFLALGIAIYLFCAFIFGYNQGKNYAISNSTKPAITDKQIK